MLPGAPQDPLETPQDPVGIPWDPCRDHSGCPGGSPGIPGPPGSFQAVPGWSLVWPWEVNRVHREVPATQAGIYIALNWVGGSRLSPWVAWGPWITSVLKVYMIECGCQLYPMAGAGSTHGRRRVLGAPLFSK